MSWRDLSIGTNINIYNRVYRVHACDAFTRRFMEAQGRPQVRHGIDTAFTSADKAQHARQVIIHHPIAGALAMHCKLSACTCQAQTILRTETEPAAMCNRSGSLVHVATS